MNGPQHPPSGPDRPFWTWPTIAVWVLIAAAAVWLRGPLYVGHFTPPEGGFTDFFQEWASARNLIEGRPVYMDQAEAVRIHLGREVEVGTGLKYNAHPPTSVLFGVPFAKLDYREAHLAWSCLMTVLLVVSLIVVIRGLGIAFPPWGALPLLALFLLCAPLSEQLYQGQWNLALLALIVGTWAFDRSDRPYAAGVLLGTATALKLFPGFLFLYFLFRGRWQVLLAGVATFAALTGATVAAMGTGPIREYVTEVIPHVSEQFRGSWWNVSLTGYWTRLFGPASSGPAPAWEMPLLGRVMIAVCSLAVVAVVAWAAWRADGRDARDRAFCLAVTGMVLVSPIAWVHYFLMLILPLAWLWQRLPAEGGRRWALRGVIVLFCVNPPLFFALAVGADDARRALQQWAELPPASPWQTLSGISIPFYALIGLFVLLAVTRPNRP